MGLKAFACRQAGFGNVVGVGGFRIYHPKAQNYPTSSYCVEVGPKFPSNMTPWDLIVRVRVQYLRASGFRAQDKGLFIFRLTFRIRFPWSPKPAWPHRYRKICIYICALNIHTYVTLPCSMYSRVRSSFLGEGSASALLFLSLIDVKDKLDDKAERNAWNAGIQL